MSHGCLFSFVGKFEFDDFLLILMLELGSNFDPNALNLDLPLLPLAHLFPVPRLHLFPFQPPERFIDWLRLRLAKCQYFPK